MLRRFSLLFLCLLLTSLLVYGQDDGNSDYFSFVSDNVNYSVEVLNIKSFYSEDADMKLVVRVLREKEVYDGQVGFIVYDGFNRFEDYRNASHLGFGLYG